MLSTCIIIVTYNRLVLLKECIEHALKQTYGNNTLLIVDNASTDGTKEYLKSLDNEKIKIVYEETNLGGAGGFADGVKHAMNDTDADWFLLIDDDAMIDFRYLEEINNIINSNKTIKAFSGTVIEHGEIACAHRRRFKKGEVIVQNTEYNNEFFNYDISSFCGLLINRFVVEKIGYPNSAFFIWYDDTEYSLRLSKISSIINVNKAILIHKTNNPKVQSSAEKYEWRKYYGMRNRFYAYSRNGQIIYALKVMRKDLMKIWTLKKDKKISEHDRQYNKTMILDSYRDAIIGRLGKNMKYLP